MWFLHSTGGIRRIAFYSSSDLVTLASIIRIYQLELVPFIRNKELLLIFLQNIAMVCKEKIARRNENGSHKGNCGFFFSIVKLK